MSTTRLDKSSDATWCRAWVCDTTVERTALAANWGDPLGPKRGDMVLDNQTSQLYMFTNSGAMFQITGLASLPIDLNSDVTGLLPLANLDPIPAEVTIGTVVNVPYNAGDYTGSGSLVWTVASGDVTDFSYCFLNDKYVNLNIRVEGTDISGTGTTLTIALPAAITPLKGAAGPCLIADNGSLSVLGFYSIAAGVPEISFLLSTVANFAASSGGTAVYPSSFTYQVAP